MAATFDIEAAKAAFLAKGNSVTTAPTGIAYGVDRAADKAKRAAARAAWRSAWDHASVEHEAEIAFQRGVEENGYFKS